MLSAFGMAWFLLAIYALRPGYIAMDDPQFLALALVSSGAVVFLNAEPPKLFQKMLLAAALIVAAGLVKQNVFALPASLCTWAVFYDRRRLALFAAAGALVGGAALALLYGLWGQALVDDVLFQPRLAAWQKSIAMTRQILPLISLFLVCALAGSILLRPLKKAAFVFLFLLWSAAAGFWMASGAGVNYNIIFDLMIALAVGCVAAVLAAGRMKLPGTEKIRRRSLLTVLAVTQAALTLHYYHNPYARDIDALIHAREWTGLTDQLAQAQGPVACEVLATCYWAHKPLEVDFFNYGQKLLTGAVPDTAFRERIGRKYYAYVVVQKSGLQNPQLPVDTMQWLFSNYAPVRLVDGDTLLLAPRS